MGAEVSKTGNNSGDDSDGEDWMQADKYAEWKCADHMDYNGTAICVRHVEMPLNSEEKERLKSGQKDDPGITGDRFRFTHEALVFDVICVDGRRTTFTAELTFSGVLKRWGHHSVISRVKNTKYINVPVTELLDRIATKKPYNLFSYNCKHYCGDKIKMF